MTRKYVREVKPGGKWACDCGRKNKLNSYVSAHWRDMLEYVCPGCDAKYTIVAGSLTRVRKGKKS